MVYLRLLRLLTILRISNDSSAPSALFKLHDVHVSGKLKMVRLDKVCADKAHLF